MANIILQHFDGQLRELDKLSISNIQQYAKMVGADYKMIVGKPFNARLTSACQKVHVLSAEFDQYDDVMMLDIDMFAPKEMTDNVFNEVGVGLYGPVQRRLHSSLVFQYRMLGSLHAPYWGGAIYKMSKSLRQKLRKQLESHSNSWMDNFNRPYHFEDEGIMHVLAHKAKVDLHDTALDPRWCHCSFLPNPEKAGFIHIRTKITPNGPKREKIENYNSLVRAGII